MKQWAYKVWTLGLLLGLGSFSASKVEAQGAGRVSAFSTCLDAEGVASLCTMRGRNVAEGFSAGEEGGFASLVASSDGFYMPADVCDSPVKAAAIRVRLLHPRPDIGERIYFDDFMVEAFDDEGAFLPELAIVVVLLSQPDALLVNANWDYIEVGKPGLSSLMVFPYCQEGADVAGSVQLTVGF